MKELRSSVLVFLAGAVLSFSLVAVSAAQPAQAGLGSNIVCFVFDVVTNTGDPIPDLADGESCQNPPDAPKQCADTIDNDGDGLTDFPADPGCTSESDNNEFNVAPTGAENTLALCSDTLDNDSDTLIDLADPDCAAYKPTLTVTKIVSGGAALVNQFSLFLDGLAVTSGVATTTTVGTHMVSETASSTYPGTFSGDCNSAGQVLLAIGDAKNCTITNTFTPSTTTPPATTQCNNTTDDDGDGLVDSADPGCHTDFNASNSSSYNPAGNNESATAPQSSGGGGGGSGGGGGGGGGTISGPLSLGFVNTNVGGQVLGTTTSCGVYLTDYMRIGYRNNKTQVVKLQTFLNQHMSAGLPVTGFFGPLTDAAVRKFQAQYAADILEPWIPHGLIKNQTTGYVYKTTLRKINLIMCTELNVPMPMLP